jgi:hypothetical protein
MRFFVLALLLLCSCPGKSTPPPVVPPDSKDPEADCAMAEERLLQLACRDAKGRLLGGPNRRGEPFRSVCLISFRNGVSVHPLCLSHIDSCEDIQDCDGAK